MRIGTETGHLAVSGAAMALLFAIAILCGPGAALAIANQTVLCQGTITTSTDPSVPIGPTFSVGNVAVNSKATNKNCTTTVSTVTQVTQGTCNGQTPCVVTLTETNLVPVTTNPGCGAGVQTPGITVSNITASSNTDLIGCSVTSVADAFSSKSGAYTMTLTPTTAGSSTCEAAGTGGFTICTSYSQ